uniref:Nuclear receptor n=1 Tax=Meloidogyne floridensis TaxID=298350 RepID=A0A915P6R4_9BILA
MSLLNSFQNLESNDSICNISTFYSLEFNTNDYISLEDLENQLDKEALLCFSKVPDNNNDRTVIINENNNEKNTKLSKKVRPTDCVVCARPTKCCHFDVPSCLGCRSFFRRSVLNQRSYICKKNEKCQIEKGELCRSCRFDRCLLGGMDFRTIQKFPDGFNIEQISALLTEKKRQLKENSSIMQKQILLRTERPEVELLQILLYSDNNLLHIRHSETDFPSSIFYNKSLSDIIIGGGGLNYSILSRSDQFSNQRRVPKSFAFYQERLRESDKIIICEGNESLISPNWLFIDSFLIIEMTKTLPVFSQLSFEDKLRLYTRNGLATIVFSQLYYSLNIHGSEILIFPNGFSPSLFPTHSKLTHLIFYKHIIKMKEFNLSREEFLIIRTLIFLHTGLSINKYIQRYIQILAKSDLSMIGYEIVQTEIEKLSKALMFYECRKWGDPGGAGRFVNLMMTLNAAFQFEKTHRIFLQQHSKLKNMIRPKFMHAIFEHSDERTLS